LRYKLPFEPNDFLENKPSLEARVTQLAEEFPLYHETLKFIMMFHGPLEHTLI